MKPRFFSRHKETIFYSLIMGIALFALRFLEIRFFVFDYTMEFFVAGIALLFTALGIWLALKLVKPKTVIVEKMVPAKIDIEINQAELDRLGISKRELEVLQLMAKGHSNNEIASELFVSLNTVKTHAANIFEKLEVARRTQAVEKAKKLGLLA
ncbi:DNA-binding response regulator [Flavobacterium sp. MAH-1]|uniref:DNA-binding response regulator n=1 Tax=Flavobacterium agri TaxID=2743471 RepID=A0A7Y9C4G9_9FLAO|nr:LuxR C-terminal-related transcriptional regulator [Flavobacterium agri]NUY79875.1 DNA-binding response regulator [Flavobacterium agri]NYA69900.1 DNA-binding response regulator [Flavobacterium agri]